MTTELIFLVEASPQSGFEARALGVDTFTEADTLPELRDAVRDAVQCHYDHEDARPALVRLHHMTGRNESNPPFSAI